MNIINNYYKNSNTGQLILEVVFESDIINNINKKYYDIHNRYLNNKFNLSGFLPIKSKKWFIYQRSRCKMTEINFNYYDTF